MPAFATLNEFAAILKCTPRMVRKHRAAGRLVEDAGRIVVHASIERIAALRDPTRGGYRQQVAAPERQLRVELDDWEADDDPLPPPGSRPALFNALLHVAADAWCLIVADGIVDRLRDPATLRDALQRAADLRVAQWRSGQVVGLPDEGAGGPLEGIDDAIPLHLCFHSLPAVGVTLGSQVPDESRLTVALAATLDRVVAFFTDDAGE